MRAESIINLHNIRRNYEFLRKKLAPEVLTCVSVKANAYGHGLDMVVRTLKEYDVSYFGVASFEEASQVLSCDIKEDQKVLVYSILSSEDIERSMPYLYKIEYMISDFTYFREIEQSLHSFFKEKKITVPAQVHLKIDTGMGRLGVKKDEWEILVNAVIQSPHMEIKGICSHFSDSADDISSARQEEMFQDAYTYYESYSKGKGLTSPIRHIANSGGVLWNKKVHYEMVRLGIALYGSSPSDKRASRESLSLFPTMTLVGKIARIDIFPKNASISYGSSYHTKEKTHIAVVNIGYGDGLMRALSNGGKVWIEGNTYFIVGLICMDMCMVDLGAQLDTEIKRGTMVEFFGSHVSVDKQAVVAQTISYELFCSVSERVHRRYLQ